MNSALANEEGLRRFPERLKALLEDRHISQRRLADELGVSKQTVTNWMQGHNEPSLRNLCGIARLLGIAPGELLKAADDPDSPHLDDTATSLLRELTLQPMGPAVRSLQAAAPDLLDLLNRAERYVSDLDRQRDR
jgi:transcriptional regulator with XRE-family HTH domain